MSVGVYIAWPQQTRTGFRSVFCAKSYKIKKNRPTARPSQQQQQRLCRLVTHMAGIYSDCSSREIVVCVWCAWYAVWSTRTLQAAEQLKCSSLVCVHRTEFLLHAGDRRWLASSDGRLPRLVPFKLHNLQLLNKILAHRPWALDHSLIAVSSLMIINSVLEIVTTDRLVDVIAYWRSLLPFFHLVFHITSGLALANWTFEGLYHVF